VQKEPFDSLSPVLEFLRQWAAYSWILILAWFGGFVNYMKKVRNGEVGRFNITEFLGDMLTSSFAGVITFLFCKGAGFNEWLTAALVGMSGHMGSRALFMFEHWLAKRYGLGKQEDGK